MSLLSVFLTKRAIRTKLMGTRKIGKVRVELTEVTFEVAGRELPPVSRGSLTLMC